MILCPATRPFYGDEGKDMNEKYHNTKPIKVGNDEKNRINRIYLDVARGCSRSCRFCINGYLYKPIIEASVEKLLDVAEKSRKNSGINKLLLTADSVKTLEEALAK